MDWIESQRGEMFGRGTVSRMMLRLELPGLRPTEQQMDEVGEDMKVVGLRKEDEELHEKSLLICSPRVPTVIVDKMNLSNTETKGGEY